jgi:hypothetical protein
MHAFTGGPQSPYGSDSSIPSQLHSQPYGPDSSVPSRTAIEGLLLRR